MKIKIAAFQSSLLWQDISGNLNNFKDKIAQEGANTDLIILPEMFLTGFVVNPTEYAISMDGAEISTLKQLSKEYDVVIAGSVIIRESENYYNRFLWIQPDGDVSYYDKRHLFTFGGEDKNFVAGQKDAIFCLKGIKIKPLVCYDLRFPVWAKNSYDEGNGYEYDVLIYTANWPAPRAEVWKTLLKARAIENQCFVIGVNRVGTDGEGLSYTGDSRIINARGEIVAETQSSENQIIRYCIDKKELETFRSKFPVGPDWDIFSIQ